MNHAARHPIAAARAYWTLGRCVAAELAAVIPQIVPELIDRHLSRQGRRQLWETIAPGIGHNEWAAIVDHARRAARHSGHSLDEWLDAYTMLAQLGWTRADVLALDPVGLAVAGLDHEQARDVAWAINASLIGWHR